jgi:hypothetical protein
MTPTQEQLRALFTYDPEEPFPLRWREKPSRGRNAGAVAGFWHTTRGRGGAQRTVITRYIKWEGIRVPLVNAVWIYHYGHLPLRKVVHREGRTDFRITNLIEQPDRQTPRERMLYFNYGITCTDYENMCAAQGGVCAICRKAEVTVRDGITDPLSVDHCAKTGAVRGLLCGACNRGIGHMLHDPISLRRAADYLETTSGRAPPGAGQNHPRPKRLLNPKPVNGLPVGVRKHGPSYRAIVCHNYETIHVGVFPSAEEAAAARSRRVAELRGAGHGKPPSISKSGHRKNPPTEAICRP